MGQTEVTKVPLIPAPRELDEKAVLPLTGSVTVRSSLDNEDLFAAKDLVNELHLRDIPVSAKTTGVSIELLRLDTPKAASLLAAHHLVFTDTMRDEGYALLYDRRTFYDIAATSTGIFYGVQTIKQLVTGHAQQAVLQTAKIRDWPAMKYRGQDDDLSRGPFPTLDYQKKQIRTLAAFKINIYSPYFENNLQYASDPLIAPPGGSMSRTEVEELVRFAQQYHVSIVPQQEAFGHLHHVLMHERYNHLSETPHGTVLAPEQPGSLQLTSKWFAQVAQMFPGPFLHIGADETDDLGLGQTKGAVASRGLVPVYIDFITQVHEALRPLHKRLLFWGDVAMNSPESVKNLPKDMIAVPWQYSMQEHGFDKWIAPFRDSGIETWVAPSANRGNRIFPDNDNNLKTIQAFVTDGQRLGSTGMLNTVWNDGGEGIFEQNWYGVLYGASSSWQSGKADIEQFEQDYGRVFHNDSSGKVNQAEIALMNAHLILAKADLQAKNVLFWEDPWSKNGQQDTLKILPVAHDLRMAAEDAIILLEEAKKQPEIRNIDALDAMEIGARKMDFIGQKFLQAEEMRQEYSEMYAHQADVPKKEAVSDMSFTLSGNNGQCQDLRDGYGLIRDLFRAAWLKESRPYWLDNVTAQYDLNMQLWIQRGVVIRAAGDDYEKTGHLPTPQELEIPATTLLTR
ncbi:glycoside hydrolase family 20 zincin-like fold domain-containing protein [Terriglobus sp. 2YAB30_2]|uniref:glycoside hydrolase family 20 zincin-like fold domain-containing protein n=2 Tax=unclassified Terriglobus TaxID=2628988 RepID=UPI003F9B2C3B